MSSEETSSRHTAHTGLTPKDAYNAITDPDVLPTLDEAAAPRKIQSHLVLLVLLAGALGGAWFLGVDILQSQTQVIGVGVAVAIAIAFIGGFNIDWWELVLGYCTYTGALSPGSSGIFWSPETSFWKTPILKMCLKSRTYSYHLSFGCVLVLSRRR